MKKFTINIKNLKERVKKLLIKKIISKPNKLKFDFFGGEGH